MELKEAKDNFIQSWGTLGSNWGINKTMAQIHGLLLVSPEVMSTEEIMKELQISRGNANMSIRSLMDWGIVSKQFKAGERKDFFKAEKDVWEVMTQVVAERRKREIEPLLKMLDSVQNITDKQTEEGKEFIRVTKDLLEVTKKSDKLLAKLVAADQHWFLGLFTKMFK